MHDYFRQVGVLKLWDRNFYNQMRISAHENVAIRGLATGPNSHKLVTCADEPVVKLFDFKTLQQERQLQGHGYDVRAVAWHPGKALIATGSKDYQIKLYDPRVEKEVRF